MIYKFAILYKRLFKVIMKAYLTLI